MSLRLAWALLVLLTLTSVALAEGAGGGSVIVVALFAAAAVKALIVAYRYMEIDRAAEPWRHLYPTWIVAVGAMLAVGHLLG